MNNPQMPSFARIQWASKEIKDKYEPKFEKAKRFFNTMEVLSVSHKLRDASTGSITPDKFLDYQQNLLKLGLHFTPFKKVGSYRGLSYYHPNYEAGRPWFYYGCITRDVKAAQEFLRHDEEINHLGIGELLGYPSCCTNQFNNHFGKDNLVDLTWVKAIATSEKYIKEQTENTIVLKDIPWQLNAMFRAFGLMSSFHTACSFYCEESLQLINSWIDFAKEEKIEGLEELELFLRMPYEWDSFKGIAYIRTPLFKMAANSNFSFEKQIVRVEGTYYPLDAPKGLRFPFDNQTKLLTLKANDNQLSYAGGGVE